MSVDATTVRRIAHLARIAVADEEVEHLQGELNAILAFVEQLSEVNVDGVEPMTSVTPMEMKKRPDVVTDGDIPDDIVRNAPATEDIFSWFRRWWNEDGCPSSFHHPRASEREPRIARGSALMCLACEEQDFSSACGAQGSLRAGSLPPGVTEEDLDAMGFELPAAMRGKPKPEQPAATAAPTASAFSCDSPDGE